jgi:hypothetical protein
MDDTLNFIIENYDLQNNSATVKPYSPLFANPISAYPSFNLTLTTLNPNISIPLQIAANVQSIIDSILASEKPVHSNIADYFANLTLNQVITVPLSAYTPPQFTSSQTTTPEITATPVDLSELNINFIN